MPLLLPLQDNVTALVILAAGKSSRMGKPKQNLLFRGKTLLQHVVETAVKTSCKPIMVILGANKGIIRPTLNYPQVSIMQNGNWQEGIASSIRVAINTLKADANIDSILFLLCDQPFITSTLIETILNTQKQTGKNIVACTYSNAVGVPMLFKKTLFNDLHLLQGLEGARKLLDQYPDDIALVPFDEGGRDIDTPDDYEQLIR